MGSNTKANLGSVVLENSTVRGNISNRVSGGAVTNVAVGSGAEANSGSVVVKNRGIGGAGTNSGTGVVVNDVRVPFGGMGGTNTNVAIGGKSNKNSVVFK